MIEGGERLEDSVELKVVHDMGWGRTGRLSRTKSGA